MWYGTMFVSMGAVSLLETLLGRWNAVQNAKETGFWIVFNLVARKEAVVTVVTKIASGFLLKASVTDRLSLG